MAADRLVLPGAARISGDKSGAPPNEFGGDAMGQAVQVGVSRLIRHIARSEPASGPACGQAPGPDVRYWRDLRGRPDGRPVHRVRVAGRRDIWPAVSPPRSRLGWILITQLQKAHLTLPSSSISVLFDLPQFRQCQFRTVDFMEHSLSRRKPATGACQAGGRGPSGGSESRILSRGGSSGRRPVRPGRKGVSDHRLWWGRASSAGCSGRRRVPPRSRGFPPSAGAR